MCGHLPVMTKSGRSTSTNRNVRSVEKNNIDNNGEKLVSLASYLAYLSRNFIYSVIKGTLTIKGGNR